MSEWNLLKEYEFEDRTVRLYRSNYTMRRWKGETVFRTGKVESVELENEKEAWMRFTGECVIAIYAMQERHT